MAGWNEGVIHWQTRATVLHSGGSLTFDGQAVEVLEQTSRAA